MCNTCMSFYQRCSEFKARPFQQHQPLQGDAPRAWENFCEPKLWSCDFAKDWEWKALLGAGVDGFVSEVTILGKSYALKVVSVAFVMQSVAARRLSFY